MLGLAQKSRMCVPLHMIGIHISKIHQPFLDKVIFFVCPLWEKTSFHLWNHWRIYFQRV